MKIWVVLHFIYVNRTGLHTGQFLYYAAVEMVLFCRHNAGHMRVFAAKNVDFLP
jgi:hypothetical protein